jgi:hypothetical protein
MNETPAERLARLKRLAALPDAAIDFSDIPEMTEAQMASAVVVRGGYRVGAGRKSTGHVQLGLSVSPKAREALRRRAAKEHKSMSAIVEAFLLGS